MKRKTIFLLLLLVSALVSAIIFIEINRPPSLEPSPIIDEAAIEVEIDQETYSETTILEEEALSQEEELEEQTLPERVFSVIQDTFSNLFTQEVNVVAIGDSLTQGVGDETKQGGYVGIMDRSLNQDNQIVHFENFGVRGNRTEQLLERMQQPEIQTTIRDADFIFVTIGANDIMKVLRENITNLKLEAFIDERNAFEERLHIIVDEMRELNKDAHLYLIGIYNPFEMYFEDIEELNLIVDSWNETSLLIAESETDSTFIPIDDLFQDTTINLFAEDNFHPNYQGYYLISERVLDYLTEEDE